MFLVHPLFLLSVLLLAVSVLLFLLWRLRFERRFHARSLATQQEFNEQTVRLRNESERYWKARERELLAQLAVELRSRRNMKFDLEEAERRREKVSQMNRHLEAELTRLGRSLPGCVSPIEKG